MPHLRTLLSFLLLCSLASPTLRAEEPRLLGTNPLQLPNDLVQHQLKQVYGYFKGRIAAAEAMRDQSWKPDYSSQKTYRKSLAPHRKNLRQMLGLIKRTPQPSSVQINKIADESSCRIDRVTIPITDNLAARGLMLTPKQQRKKPAIIVCSDADTWPEQFAGLIEGGSVAPWLTELLGRGITIYLPQSIERLQDHPYCKQTRDKDRRWILHRLGYAVGRTTPGLDVQDITTAVDFLATRKGIEAKKIGIVGLGEGGSTSLFAAAVNQRIAAVGVADYFENRNNCWNESFDRRMRDRLLEFGDAELAALVAPRSLTLVSSQSFHEKAYKLNAEFNRAKRFYTGLKKQNRLVTRTSDSSEDALLDAVRSVAVALTSATGKPNPTTLQTRIPAAEILKIRDLHFEERMRYLRKLIDDSEAKRYARWKLLEKPASEFASIRKEMLKDYRKLVGEIPKDGTPLNPRSELAETHDKYKTYRMTLDVIKGVQVYGNLLVPTNIEGTRPAVICQHGLNGTPEMVTGLGMKKDTVYHEFGRKLAERGYVVFAPLLLHHNPVKQITDQTRQADSVGMMRIAMPIAKTKRIIDFLETQPYVDSKRIGYYGLSYGGYSAIWMSPLCERLAVTVVSGYFNDWRTKLMSDQLATSYLLHPAEDMYDWNILHRFTHPELMMLIAPRPSCIEFGTHDGITTPEWTAYGWKQLKEMRDHAKLGDRIQLLEFNGKHEVYGLDAFKFVDRYLWPEQTERNVE